MRKAMKVICGTALLSASMSATTAGFDGSVPLLCAVTDTVSCDSKGECVDGSAEAVNLPVFLQIDVANRTAASVRASGEQRTSKILSVHEEAGALVLLGVEDNGGWSVAIGESSGKLTLTAAGAVGGALFGDVARPGAGTTAGEDALTGAAKGAVIGGIAGDAGKGAAAGAVGSLLFGGMRRNR